MIGLIGIFAILFLSGCHTNKSMTNDEIIAECKKCNDAGLTPYYVRNAATYDIVKITCYPKEEK